jgi:hypothetical protein
MKKLEKARTAHEKKKRRAVCARREAKSEEKKQSVSGGNSQRFSRGGLLCKRRVYYVSDLLRKSTNVRNDEMNLVVLFKASVCFVMEAEEAAINLYP